MLKPHTNPISTPLPFALRGFSTSIVLLLRQPYPSPIPISPWPSPFLFFPSAQLFLNSLPMSVFFHLRYYLRLFSHRHPNAPRFIIIIFLLLPQDWDVTKCHIWMTLDPCLIYLASLLDLKARVYVMVTFQSSSALSWLSWWEIFTAKWEGIEN